MSAPPTTTSKEVAEACGGLTPLLGTDDLVNQHRPIIPGGLSKRTVYHWLDLGCPHNSPLSLEAAPTTRVVDRRISPHTYTTTTRTQC